MNIQTERLDNQIARLTVEIEGQRWEQAKQKAARELSRRYRIPGFRKGKAPYKVVVRTLGEGPIIESAAEKLGNEVYKDVLEQSDLQPYAAGSLEDFQFESKPTYIFTIPLQPEVTLDDYRAIRLDFEVPEVTDQQVNEAMRELQQQHAVIEDSDRPVQVGNRVTLDIHSEFADDPADEVEDADDLAEDANDPAEEDIEGADDPAEEVPQNGDAFFHRHDTELTLDPESESTLR